MRTSLISLLCLLCFGTTALAHPNHELAPDFDSPAAIKRMLSFDMGPALELVSFVGPGSKGSTDYEKKYIRELTAPDGPLKADWELSEGEQRSVSLWKLPSGSYVGLTQMLREVEKYYDKWGELPHSGPELYDGLISWGGQKSWPSLTAQDIILRYYSGINPVTQRFHRDFNARKWRPGGVLIFIEDDDAMVARYFKDQKIDGKPVTRYILLKIWGEKEGTVLYEERVPRS
jgi:hypothetical protein